MQLFCAMFLHPKCLVGERCERRLLQPQVHNVRFPRVRILQQLAESVSFDTAYIGYLKGTWDADFGHWSELARLLDEAGLRVYSTDTVEQSMSGLQDGYRRVKVEVKRKILLPDHSFVMTDGTRMLVQQQTGSRSELIEKLAP